MIFWWDTFKLEVKPKQNIELKQVKKSRENLIPGF